MATEEGARQAYDDLAATYRGMTNERAEELTIPVETGAGERLELTEAEVRERAAQDPGLRLIDPADGEHLPATGENITSLLEYHGHDRMMRAIDFDAEGDPDYLGAQAEAQFASLENRGLVEAAEDREALLAEARDLASREYLTPEQRDRLVEVVEEVAGKDAVHELRAGNSDALSEILPDKADRLDVAEKYLEAEREKGLDRDDALTVVQKERELMEIDEKIEQQSAVERETEAQRGRSRDDGHDL